MEINKSMILESAIDEMTVALSNGLEAIRNGMWISLFGEYRPDFSDDVSFEIKVDGKVVNMTALEIDELILSKCEDLTVDISKAIKSENGMVLILNEEGM